MKMTTKQFREWAAAAEFSAEQGAELGGETHKAVGYTDDGEPILVEWGYGCVWRTLTATLPNGEPFQATTEIGVEFPGSERARIKDEYETYPTEQGTTWQGLAITDDDGDDLDEQDQAAEIEEALEVKGLAAYDLDALLPRIITTDIDIDMKDLEEALELIILTNDNAPDIRFKGELIAEVSSSANNASGSYSGATGRWTELKLYRTTGGRYVAQSVGHTQWQGEHTRYSTVVCETAADVIDFFGHGWLAKSLYNEADIEDVQDVE